MKLITWNLHTFPRIRIAGRYPMPAQNDNIHYLDPTHALHLIEYDAVFKTKTESYRVSPGDLTLTPAGLTTYCTLEKPSHHICIHFWPLEARANIHLPHIIRLGEDRPAVQQRLWRILDIHRRGLSLGKKGRIALATASSELQSLLLWMAHHHSTKAAQPRHSRSADICRAAMNLIENDYAKPLNISDFAETHHLSPNHLSRAFHQRYGAGILKALISRRVEVARHLLCNSDFSIKEIGSHVGFPDPQHFNKQFRRIIGQSPSSYRITAKRTTDLMGEKWIPKSSPTRK